MAGEEDSVWRVLPGTQVHPTRRGKAWSHVPELQVTSGVPQGRACFLPAPVLTAAVTGTAGISIPGIMGGTIPGICVIGGGAPMGGSIGGMMPGGMGGMAGGL